MENQTQGFETDPRLWNSDLKPTVATQRTWNAWNIAALWIGMAICVPAYLLASSLIAEGMSPGQAMLTVFLGNVIVLIPMLLVGHAGAKYGVPFPVLLRASFGTIGARLPGLLRGLVACGWFGIQTWLGGSAMYEILNAISSDQFKGAALPFLDIDISQLVCFFVFWFIQLYFIWRGVNSIRWLETLAAPFLLLTLVAMWIWALRNGGGVAETFSQPSQFIPGGEKEGQFWVIFWPSLTAMVGFWATLSLNIPDFTRFARGQKEQVLGQALGLPVPMLFIAFVSVSVTTATVSVFGEQMWDPVKVAGRMGGVTAIAGLFVLVLATLTTNLAANVVAPANGFSNLSPRRISFRAGGLITAGLGIAIMPWKLLATAGNYLFVWLVGYSSLLGPIAGILIADYFFVRKRNLRVDAFYRQDSEYHYQGGWNVRALVALALGVLPNLPGFLSQIGVLEGVWPFVLQIYNYAWFVGAFVSGLVYFLLMRGYVSRDQG